MVTPREREELNEAMWGDLKMKRRHSDAFQMLGLVLPFVCIAFVVIIIMLVW